MTLAIDHLAVAAASLDEGVAWCEATFGVTPQGRLAWQIVVRDDGRVLCGGA